MENTNVSDSRDLRFICTAPGRTGLEIAEKLGKKGYEVVATKRTDPIGSMMETITRNLALKRIEQMPKVTLMPHTTIHAFFSGRVDMEQDRRRGNSFPKSFLRSVTGLSPKKVAE
jgi:heterodisulfide reductase subunit A-like polyferredoxin